jgi:hypothetical protein
MDDQHGGGGVDEDWIRGALHAFRRHDPTTRANPLGSILIVLD